MVRPISDFRATEQPGELPLEQVGSTVQRSEWTRADDANAHSQIEPCRLDDAHCLARVVANETRRQQPQPVAGFYEGQLQVHVMDLSSHVYRGADALHGIQQLSPEKTTWG